MAQSVKCPTSAQVTISQTVSSSPASGSGLTARRLEPASGSGSPSFSAPPPLVLCLSLSPSKTNKHYKKFFKRSMKPITVAQKLLRPIQPYSSPSSARIYNGAAKGGREKDVVQGFSARGPGEVCTQVVLGGEGCSGHCRMSDGIPGLYLPARCQPHPPPLVAAVQCLQTRPRVPLENCRSRGKRRPRRDLGPLSGHEPAREHGNGDPG